MAKCQWESLLIWIGMKVWSLVVLGIEWVDGLGKQVEPDFA